MTCDRFGVSMLVDVLKTHPKVLLDGMVLDNPHYLTPREYLAAETGFRHDPVPPGQGSRPRTRVIATDPWQSLTDAELRIAELVAGGMTNRHIADYLNPLAPHDRRTSQAHLHQARHPLTRRAHGAGPAARLVGSGLIGAFDPCSAS